LLVFGGTVLKLGTSRHHGSFLDKIDTVDQIGCFGLTELGYGNNAVEMETTATYDSSTSEWIIHSPSILSQKYWITNSADHAQWCVVFAQTIVGETNHGIHGFLVRIRNQDHSIVKNVRNILIINSNGCFALKFHFWIEAYACINILILYHFRDSFFFVVLFFFLPVIRYVYMIWAIN
jgi:acyl-CoA oxidase